MRSQSGWTQDELARRSGLTQQNIASYETGRVKHPRFLIEIADALGVDVRFLLGNGNKKPDIAFTNTSDCVILPREQPFRTTDMNMMAVAPKALFFEGSAVRIMIESGEPWFILTDVCHVLDIRNARDAAARLDADEKGVGITDTPGGTQKTTTVNESGLYSLILTSRKESAKRFKKWVTAEVLPSIRKTGQYGGDPITLLGDPDMLRTLLFDYAGRVKELQAENTVLLPKADALDRIATADGSLTITEVAKTMQIKPKELFRYMRTNGWIYRRDGGKSFLGYQAKTDIGLLEHKVTTLRDEQVVQVRVTPKGMAKLATIF